MAQIRESIGELPIITSEDAETNEEESTPTVASPKAPAAKRILADGTYATETAYTSTKPVSPTTTPKHCIKCTDD